MLGIIIGVGAVIALMAVLGRARKRALQDEDRSAWAQTSCSSPRDLHKGGLSD